MCDSRQTMPGVIRIHLPSKLAGYWLPHLENGGMQMVMPTKCHALMDIVGCIDANDKTVY